MLEFLGDLLGAGASVATGGLFGAAMRLIPALFTGIGKMLTAKGDRDHEYRMLKLQADIAKDQGEQRLREMDTSGRWDEIKATLGVWKSALEAQGRQTGVAWVDAANAFVRPFVTYYYLAMFFLTKLCLVVWPELAPIWNALWTPADQQMMFGILGFWFVDRQLGKAAVSK